MFSEGKPPTWCRTNRADPSATCTLSRTARRLFSPTSTVTSEPSPPGPSTASRLTASPPAVDLPGHVRAADGIAGAVVGIGLSIRGERAAAGHIDHRHLDGAAGRHGAFGAFQRRTGVGQLTDGRTVRGAGRGQPVAGGDAWPGGDGHIHGGLTRHRADGPQAGRRGSAAGQVAGFAAQRGDRPAFGPAAGLRHSGQRNGLRPEIGGQTRTDGGASRRGGAPADLRLADGAFRGFGPLVLGRGQQFTAAGSSGRSGYVQLGCAARCRSAAGSDSNGAGGQRIGVRTGDRPTGSAAARERSLAGAAATAVGFRPANAALVASPPRAGPRLRRDLQVRRHVGLTAARRCRTACRLGRGDATQAGCRSTPQQTGRPSSPARRRELRLPERRRWVPFEPAWWRPRRPARRPHRGCPPCRRQRRAGRRRLRATERPAPAGRHGPVAALLRPPRRPGCPNLRAARDAQRRACRCRLADVGFEPGGGAGRSRLTGLRPARRPLSATVASSSGCGVPCAAGTPASAARDRGARVAVPASVRRDRPQDRRPSPQPVPSARPAALPRG